ncbi:MAG TPA: EsaB/YukD family protein, partial [Pseudonocardia sp.]|nr:EsaB/YukD family protein [Pseudonocardia sp.]
MTTTAGPGAARSGQLTRITLVGRHRRADLVLPSDEPLGLMLPDILALVGGAGGSGPHGYQLTAGDGSALDLAATPRAAGIADGALLRLDPVTEAPPAPILHDVGDHVADDLAQRRGRWGPEPRRWAATLTTVSGGLLAALLAGPHTGWIALLAAGLVLAAAGAAVAAAGRRHAGAAVL